MFLFTFLDRAQRPIAFELTDQKTKDCARSGSFQHNLQHHCFSLFSTLLFAVFHSQSPLLTLFRAKNIVIRE